MIYQTTTKEAKRRSRDETRIVEVFVAKPVLPGLHHIYGLAE
jgi:hypothetical protein